MSVYDLRDRVSIPDRTGTDIPSPVLFCILLLCACVSFAFRKIMSCLMKHVEHEANRFLACGGQK